MLCQAAEDLGYDNDICGYARISLAYAAGYRVGRKFDPVTKEFIINPASGKPLKGEDGKPIIDEATGKPKKDPKTQSPYEELVNIFDIEKIEDEEEREFRLKALKPIRQNRMPKPDFVLCCNNICNCMTKWYENIARMANIPLVMIDIPYNNDVDVDDSKVRYVRAQFDAAIKQLEKISGRKFDEKKFEEACKNANRTARAWLKVCDYLQYKPAPMSGFDLFNHMADVVTARARVDAAEAFELLAKDLEDRHLHPSVPGEEACHVRGNSVLAEAPGAVQAAEGERNQRHRSRLCSGIRLRLQQPRRDGKGVLQGSELCLHRAGRCMA